MLEVSHLSFQYGEKKVLKDISFSVKKGELIGILGPNGSGKTTLIKLISGILEKKSGEIVVKGKNIQDYKQKDLASVIAVLSQHVQESFSYSVKEIVSLGRYAHQKGLFQTISSIDYEVMEKVMKQTGVAGFQDMSIHELSGGEKQRVYLAQSLTQEPEILLLDEPTNHLDLSYQKELLDTLKEWTMEKDLTVICIFHDLNLAGLYCDRLLLLQEGRLEIDAPPVEVLVEERIKRVYQTSMQRTFHPTTSAPQIALLPQKGQEKLPRVDVNHLEISKEHVKLIAPFPLKTLSSGVTGAGMGWYQHFINRHVDLTYQCDDYRAEMDQYLVQRGLLPSTTVGMMTAVLTEDASYRFIEEEGVSALIVVTVGIGHAVDAAKASEHDSGLTPGTINIWAFVNGELSDQAFVQSIITITEAKAAFLRDYEIKDKVTVTVATGTSTDSVLIAATQQGNYVEFAGTITLLGKMLSRGVYKCLSEAISKTCRRDFS